MRASIALLLLLSAVARADTLALKDGRFFDGKIDRAEKGYVIHFKHGDVTIPADIVSAYFKDGGEGGVGFVPTTPKEKAKYEKGYVPWKGRWLKIDAAKRAHKRELEERKQRLEQMKQRRLWRNHATVKTKRFIFKHTLPDDIFQEFKDLFETYYTFFTKYWKIRPEADFGTVTINIYHSLEYFEQVSGAPSGVIGYYVPTERDLHFFYDREQKAYTIDVMFHEGNHMLTHMINKDRWYPWWVGEGMAEYFGASHWDPEKKTMTLGHMQSGRLAVLQAQIRDEKWLKLKDLLEAPSMGAIEYAWTWSFCHFLLHTPKYAKGFKKYFIAIGRDQRLKTVARFAQIRQLPPTEVVAAFKKYVKVKDLDALQKEWYEYIKNALALERQKLDWGQAAFIMQLYGEHAKARKFFKKAIDEGSKSAFVLHGYASLKLRQGMPGIAIKYSKQAIESDPMHARAWSTLGQALLKKGEDKKEGMRCLELAAEMAPDDQQIWFALTLAKDKERADKEKKG